jgi:hypothetical protein
MGDMTMYDQTRVLDSNGTGPYWGRAKRATTLGPQKLGAQFFLGIYYMPKFLGVENICLNILSYEDFKFKFILDLYLQ